MLFQGLQTAIYKVPDIVQAKEWYTRALGLEPYYDQPYYVGFSVGGYALGLQPHSPTPHPGPGGGVAYWGVADIEAAVRHLQAVGAAGEGSINDVGDGIRVAVLNDPFGNLLRVIQ